MGWQWHQLDHMQIICTSLQRDIHRSNGDCLVGKRENYLVCSVQYCAQQLCTVQCTHI